MEKIKTMLRTDIFNFLIMIINSCIFWRDGTPELLQVDDGLMKIRLKLIVFARDSDAGEGGVRIWPMICPSSTAEGVEEIRLPRTAERLLGDIEFAADAVYILRLFLPDRDHASPFSRILTRLFSPVKRSFALRVLLSRRHRGR